jgi:ribosome-binding protein aMBF1 (putative translation factor)
LDATSAESAPEPAAEPAAEPAVSPKKRGGKKASPSPVIAPFEPTGKSIRDLRSAIGLSRADFAEWIGVSTQSVSNWEKQSGPLKIRAGNLENIEALHRGHFREAE